jgi:hypothetical protein
VDSAGTLPPSVVCLVAVRWRCQRVLGGGYCGGTKPVTWATASPHSKCQCHAWTNGATRSQLLVRLFALAQKYRAAIGIKTGEEEEEEEVPLMDEEAAGAAGYMNVRAPLVHTHVRLACPSVAALVCCGRILMCVD